jgi:hypothetical protein
MNLLHRAYLMGKEAAAAKFGPVPAATPKPAPAPQAAASGLPANQLGKPTVKNPSGMGLAPRPSVAGMAGNATAATAQTSGATSGLGSGTSSLAASTPSISAPALVQQTAAQMAANVVNSTGTQMLGALPKIGEFNAGLYPDPATRPERGPKADNGRRMYGTSFSEPTRPLNDIAAAFNSLNSTRSHDVLNDMGQAEFGTPRG